MYDLPISPLLKADLMAAALDHHDIHIRVQLLDLSGGFIRDISDSFETGDIAVDADAEVTRSASLTFIDPIYSLGLDSWIPDRAQSYMDNMISVEYGIKVGASFIYTPVFKGPIYEVRRNGAALNVTCHGKEALIRETAFFNHRVFEPEAVGSALIYLTASACGETDIQVSNSGRRIGFASAITMLDDAWAWMKQAAKHTRIEIFYNGAGTLRVIKPLTTTQFAFTETSMLTLPQITHTQNEVVNSVVVVGETVISGNTTVEAVASLPNAHPDSPEALKRNNVKRWYPKVIKTGASTPADVAAIASEEMMKLDPEYNSISFECLPIPWLEEHDRVMLDFDGTQSLFRLKTFTLPLHHSGTMKVEFESKINWRL